MQADLTRIHDFPQVRTADDLPRIANVPPIPPEVPIIPSTVQQRSLLPVEKVPVPEPIEIR